MHGNFAEERGQWNGILYSVFLINQNLSLQLIEDDLIKQLRWISSLRCNQAQC